MTPWTNTTACSVECGGGTMNLERSILVHAQGTGTPCPTSTHRNTSCNAQPCPDPLTLASDDDGESSAWTKTEVIVGVSVGAAAGLFVAAAGVQYAVIPWLAAKKAAAEIAAVGTTFSPVPTTVELTQIG